jgi:hypothetical protein
MAPNKPDAWGAAELRHQRPTNPARDATEQHGADENRAGKEQVGNHGDLAALVDQ